MLVLKYSGKHNITNSVANYVFHAFLDGPFQNGSTMSSNIVIKKFFDMTDHTMGLGPDYLEYPAMVYVTGRFGHISTLLYS